MTLSRGILLKAILLGTMAVPMLTVPALGQQEVDPSWYDPWARSAKVAVRPAQEKSTESNKPRKLSSAAAEHLKNRKQARAEASHHSERTQAMAGAPPLR